MQNIKAHLNAFIAVVILKHLLLNLVTPIGLEPMTLGLGNQCSIH